MNRRKIAMAMLMIGVVLAYGWSRSHADDGQLPVITSPTITVHGETIEASHKTNFTITVSGLPAGKKLKDLHLTSKTRCTFPTLDDHDPDGKGDLTGEVSLVPASGSAQGWNVKLTNNRTQLHVYTGTGSGDAAGFGDGTYTFSLVWDPKTFVKTTRGSNWDATSDGKDRVPSTPGSPDIIGSDTGSNGNPPLPQGAVTFDNSDSFDIPIAGTTELPAWADKHLNSLDYVIYTSTEKVEDYSDSLGIGIDNSGHPVPGTWGLGFGHASGTLDGNGGVAPSFAISVPNTTALIGETFFAVLTVKDSLGQILYASDPVEITIIAE